MAIIWDIIEKESIVLDIVESRYGYIHILFFPFVLKEYVESHMQKFMIRNRKLKRK